MTWADALALAWRGVRRRAGRAALTVLSVALAATLLVALLTVAGTARTRVLSQLTKGGPLSGINVVAAEPDLAQLDRDNARPGRAKALDDAALQAIRRVPAVASVVPIRSTPVLVQAPLPSGVPAPRPARGDDHLPAGAPVTFTDLLVGVDLAALTELPVTPLVGRFPARGSSNEVAVTSGYLERLGLTRADAGKVLGSELTVGAPRAEDTAEGQRTRGRWRRYVITGVVAQEASPGQLLTNAAEVQAGRDWTLGGASFGDVDQRRALSSPYAGVFVISRQLDDVARVRAQITRIGYSTSAPENLVASVERYLRVVQIVLSGIGLIALVIASLGIANAMLAAVRERRREIGVLKAIGARDIDVLRVFLVEAVVLGLVGGLLGTLAGWAVAKLVAAVVSGYLTSQGLAGVGADLPVVVAVGGVLGSGLLALVAGAVPALRAARLPAREAVGSA